MMAILIPLLAIAFGALLLINAERIERWTQGRRRLPEWTPQWYVRFYRGWESWATNSRAYILTLRLVSVAFIIQGILSLAGAIQK
jgi:hypothetical protein